MKMITLFPREFIFCEPNVLCNHWRVKKAQNFNRFLNATLSTDFSDAGGTVRSCFHSNNLLHATQTDWTTKFKMT